MAMAFVMVMGLALGFSAKDAMASDIVVTVIPWLQGIRVTIRDNQSRAINTFQTGVTITRDGVPVTATASGSGMGVGAHEIWYDFITTGWTAGNHLFTANVTFAAGGFATGSGTNTLSAAGVWGAAATASNLTVPTLMPEAGGQPQFRATFPAGSILTGQTFGFVWSTTTSPQGTHGFSQAVIDHGAASFTGTINTAGLPHGTPVHVFSYHQPPGGSAIFSQTGLTFTWNPGSPSVRTDTVTFNTGTAQINANGTILNIGTSAITEFGFVYSNHVQTPTTASAATGLVETVTGSAAANNHSFSLNFAPQNHQNSTGTTFWVRAFARNSSGVTYGEVRQLTGITPAVGAVTMSPINVTGATTAQATINVSGIAANNILTWGVLVTDNLSGTLTRNSHPTGTVRTEGPSHPTTTTATIDLSGLSANTRYRVVAYARARNSTQYIHSSILEFTTTVAMTASIFRPTEITHNSALMSANINTQGSPILEKGFVHSRVNQTPTLNDTVVRHTSTAGGDFSSTLGNLTADTTHFVRAFARFGSGADDVVYSAVEQFRTQPNRAIVTISYRDANGVEFGTQVIDHLTIGARMTERSLIPPVGTRLAQDRFAHNVIGNDNIVVTIIPEGAPPPHHQPTPPPHHTPDPWQPGPPPPPFGGYEQPFMLGIGSFMFGPENYGTFIDVAAMLYTLLADPTQVYSSPFWFPDVDYSNPLTANIVNFVSSRGYMIGTDLNMFLTNEPMNRASVAVVIAEVLNLTDRHGHHYPFPAAFPDTAGHWAQGFIFVNAMEGIFGGMMDDYGVMVFRPEDFVTRAQLAQIFSNMFNRSGQPMSELQFMDVPPHHWAFPVIMNAAVPAP